MKRHFLSAALAALMILFCVIPAGADQTLAAADRIPVILTFLNRGVRVDTAGKYDDTYTIVRTDSGFGLIRTEFLAQSGEQQYASWDGYALWDCSLYRSYNLLGEPLAKIKMNDRLTVLEELAGCYCVAFEDGIGYVARNQVSRWAYYPPSGGGNSGGSSGGADGGDIVMRSPVLGLLSAITQTAPVDGSAVVKIEGAPVYLGFYNTGDPIDIVDQAEGDSFAAVRIDGLVGHLRSDYLPDPNFSAYKAYAAGNAFIYQNADLYGTTVKQLWTNAEITVLAEFEDSCFVSSGNSVGYMAKEKIRDTMVYFGGGGGTGGSGGSGGGAEWSDPVL